MVTGSNQGLTWPASSRTYPAVKTMQGEVALKVSQEQGVLQLWLEDRATKRQFYASLAKEDCAKIVENMGLDIEALPEMLDTAVEAQEGEGLTLDFEWQEKAVLLKLLFRPCKWMAKTFPFLLPERSVSAVDRLERRLEDVDLSAKQRLEAVEKEVLAKLESNAEEAKAEFQVQKQQLQDLKAEIQAEKQALSNWRLHVHNPSFGVAQIVGNNRALLTDEDRTTKQACAYSTGTPGLIEANFNEPVHVTSVKIAASKQTGWIAQNNSLCIYVQSPETGLYETLRANVPSTTLEETFPIGKVIAGLRLTGTNITISKLIFS